MIHNTFECTTTIEGADYKYSSDAHLYNEKVVHEFHAIQDETNWVKLSGETFDTAAGYELTVTQPV